MPSILAILMNYNQIFHVYNHANAFEDLFKDEFCYRIFLEKLNNYIVPYADILAFCLMPNHFHLVVKIRSEDNVKDAIEFLYNPMKVPKRITRVKQMMQRLKKNPDLFFSRRFSDFFNSYSKTINKIYFRRGSLFIKNFKRKIVESDHYLTHLIYYVHINPIKHEFRNEVKQWQWSSYKSFIMEDFDFLDTEYVLKHFGGVDAFIEYHKKPYRKSNHEQDEDEFEVGFIKHFKYF
jgi:putative transposase